MKPWIRPLTIVPLGLAALAEGAWIAVVAGVVQEFALKSPILSLWHFAAAAGLGVVAARLLVSRAADRWPVVGLGLVAAAALTGWLADPAAREALGRGTILAAIGAHPAGLLAGLAMLRGFAHAGEHLSSATLARLLFVGIPAIGVLAAIGGMVGEPWRGQFLQNLTFQAAVFVAAGLLALALAGFAEIQRSGAPTWRRNPVWLGLLLVLVGLIVAVSVPTSVLAGPAILLGLQLVVGFSLVPLVIAGILGGGAAGFRRTFGFIAVAAAVVWVMSFLTGSSPSTPEGSGAGFGSTVSNQATDSAGVLSVLGLVLVLVAIGILLLIRAWLRGDRRLSTGDLRDLRLAELPTGPTGPPAGPHRRPRRISHPQSAEEAYRALLADIDDRPGLARGAGDTPLEHARRLRDGAIPAGEDPRVGLLAADYGLAAYGGREITQSETRRAIDRWRRLRKTLVPPPPLPKAAEAPEGPQASSDVVERDEQDPHGRRRSSVH